MGKAKPFERSLIEGKRVAKIKRTYWPIYWLIASVVWKSIARKSVIAPVPCAVRLTKITYYRLKLNKGSATTPYRLETTFFEALPFDTVCNRCYESVPRIEFAGSVSQTTLIRQVTWRSLTENEAPYPIPTHSSTRTDSAGCVRPIFSVQRFYGRRAAVRNRKCPSARNLVSVRRA